MSTLTIPSVAAGGYVANTTILSAKVNADLSAISNWSTTIDHSNTTGSTGFWASDIKPLTAGEATFGATAIGVGFKFLANDATATPLTISGVTSQSVDIFDVTLTSGGTKVLAVLSGGQTLLGVASLANADWLRINGSAQVTGIGTSGGTVGGVTGSALMVDIVGGSNLVALNTTGDLGVLNSLTIPNSATATPFFTLGVSGAYTGGMKLFSGGGAGQFTQILTNATTVNSIGGTALIITSETTNLAAFDRSGNFGLTGSSGNKAGGTTWGGTSDARIKENVADYTKGLAGILALRPVTFDYNGKAGMKAGPSRYAGYLAQEVEGVHPEMVSTLATEEFDDLRVLDTSDITPMLVNAVKEIAAYMAAHP